VELRCGTVGRVMPHLEVKIVSEKGGVVPVGEIGEVWVRGYSVMKCYWHNEQKTRESIEDGFMKTGDLASCDAKGYFRIVGRSKDMVIRGGENVVPTEVESFLLTMPGVKDVAVIGVPDARLGEEVCAWIRTQESGTHQPITLESVKRFCTGKISHFKIPRYVFIVKEFPLTVTGKVQKNVMRDTTQKWLAEAAAPKAKL
jgi:fatty-acyl-CoA synthase